MDKDVVRLMKLSSKISKENFGGVINFYVPSFIQYENDYICSSNVSFPSISITGGTCGLMCRHCEGKVLSTMIAATSPETLVDVCRRLSAKGGEGFLLSGGCLLDGTLPLEGFLDAISHVKKEFGLTVLVHTGIIDSAMAGRLKEIGVDAALIDIVGSGDTIREILRLRGGVEDYDSSLKALSDSKIPFVPHIIVGLHNGEIRGEIKALRMISKYDPHAIVVIALIPIKGTSMEKAEPPSPTDIVKILTTARIMFPDIPIALGCMRPTGEHRDKTDALSVKAGVNAIAYPAEAAIDLAKSLGLTINFSKSCCSQIYMDLLKTR